MRLKEEIEVKKMAIYEPPTEKRYNDHSYSLLWYTGLTKRTAERVKQNIKNSVMPNQYPRRGYSVRLHYNAGNNAYYVYTYPRLPREESRRISKMVA